MSCEHAETTTVAWLYGEAPDEHAEHIAVCAECQAVVAEQEAVVTAVAHTLPAIRSAPGARSRHAWAWASAALVLLAAAWLVVARVTADSKESAPQQVAEVSTDAAMSADLAFLDPIDLQFDDLDDALDAFSDDLAGM